MASKDERRSGIMRLRVHQTEKNAFEEAAKTVSLKLADWVRSELVRAANRDLRDTQTNPQLPPNPARNPTGRS